MASPTTPVHGKLAAIWRHRPNGFVGDGLNDVTWSLSGYSGAATTYLEVVIDAAGTPDTFKWRKNGGGWTTGVAITGAAQTIADGITIAFAATTGHTVNDSWAIGYLDAEACTESGDEAQISAAANRVLNPNNLAAFTDSGGETSLIVHPSKGLARFTGNVTVVTVDGEYVPSVALEKIGYLYNWSFNVNLDLSDISRMGMHWKEHVPGQATFSGNAESYYLGKDSLWDMFEDTVDTTQELFLLKLFSTDADQDQTGDRWVCWATLNGFNVNTPLNAVVNESISFAGELEPAFVEDS